jgi:hypothetical protein
LKKNGLGYIIRGDILPDQIIDSRRLSEDENLWLKGLDNRLGTTEIRRVTTEIYRQGKAARIKAYLDVLTKANQEILQEALKMSDTALTLDKIFEEAGLLEKWKASGIAGSAERAEAEARGKARGIAEARGEARGEAKKAAEIAKNMLRSGFSVEQTATLSGLNIDKVKTLAD